MFSTVLSQGAFEKNIFKISCRVDELIIKRFALKSNHFYE